MTDEMLTERTVITKIVNPGAFVESYIARYPDLSTLEQYEAFQKADAIIALRSPSGTEALVKATSDQIWDVDGNEIWEDYMEATLAEFRTPQGAICFAIGWLAAHSARQQQTGEA